MQKTLPGLLTSYTQSTTAGKSALDVLGGIHEGMSKQDILVCVKQAVEALES